MDLNSCHKWLLLTAPVAVSIIVLGTTFGFGVFFIPLLDTFGRPRSLTAIIHAILRGLTDGFGIFSGLIISKLGIARTSVLGSIMLSLGFITSYFATSVESLCVTVGVLGGIGNSLLFNSSTTAIGQFFFGSTRALALGLQNIGISIGGMVFPAIFNSLNTHFGLRGSFLVTGGIVLNSLPVSIIFAFNRPDYRNQNDFVTESVQNAKAVSKSFGHPSHKSVKSTIVLIILGTGFCIASVTSFMGVVVDVFIWKGATYGDGVTCITIINSTALVSRIVPPLVKHYCNDSWALPASMVSCLLGVAGICVIAIANTTEVILLGGGLLGIPLGTVIIFSTMFIMDNVSSIHISVAMGVTFSWNGVMAVTTGPLFGALYDWTSSYQSVLIVVASLQTTSCLLFMAAMIVRHYGQKNTLDVTTPDENKTSFGLQTSDIMIHNNTANVTEVEEVPTRTNIGIFAGMGRTTGWIGSRGRNVYYIEKRIKCLLCPQSFVKFYTVKG